MHPDYHKFEVEDFTQDERFRRWVIQRDPESEAFWVGWLAAHPEMAGKVQLARAFLYALEEKNTALSAEELTSITEEVTEQNSARSFWRRSIFQIAASLFLVAGLSYAFWLNRTGSAGIETLSEISPVLVADFEEIENKEGQPKTITLHDGSTVTLYKKSKLRYPKKFMADQRAVYLTGQAFFDITKNPKQPFWVHTDRISTQVFGTSFMVTTQGENAKVEVRSGRVSVYTRKDIGTARRLQQNEAMGVVLTANQQASFVNKEERLVKSVVPQPIVLQKIESHAYEFDEAPISSVFDQLERTYGLPVIYDATTVKNCYITANLTDESLFDKLNLIARISHSNYEIVDGQIIIHSKGCDN
ncbi:FecR family protein [Persicitalea sp.]|uniref:FecR family protein n=1 Tax=Persicitalea sp. TaxID=3100273 RepID=UPI0035948EB9